MVIPKSYVRLPEGKMAVSHSTFQMFSVFFGKDEGTIDYNGCSSFSDLFGVTPKEKV